MDTKHQHATLLIVGDNRVGSTSLLRRFLFGVFEPNNLGQMSKVSRYMKNVYSPRLGVNVTVEFCDVEGGQMQPALTCALRSHSVAVVYDITNRSSFELAQVYLDGINPRASCLLIGNKLDRRHNRKVSFEEGRLLARIHKLAFIETSARLNHNVQEAFKIMIECVPEEYLLEGRQESRPSSRVRHWRAVCSANLLCQACHRRAVNNVNSRRTHSDG